MFFKKKKNAEKVNDDRDLISLNSGEIATLLVYTENNEELSAELRNLQGTLQFLVPSNKSDITDYDKKIKNKIGDMKIALTKSDGESSNKALDILKDIKIAIAERNARL